MGNGLKGVGSLFLTQAGWHPSGSLGFRACVISFQADGLGWSGSAQEGTAIGSPSTPAHEAIDAWGYGMASVRFICGTQQLHKQLEAVPTENASRTALRTCMGVQSGL